MDYLTTRARGGLVNFGLKDWSPWKANTSPAVTDTGYYYRDARIVAAVARMLGKDDEAKKYDALADDTRVAFNMAFFNSETGSYSTGTQTALGCALYQGLAEPENEIRVITNLVAAIARTDNHLDFGYLGSQYVPNALAAHGRADVAYAMLTQSPPCPATVGKSPRAPRLVGNLGRVRLAKQFAQPHLLRRRQRLDDENHCRHKPRPGRAWL